MNLKYFYFAFFDELKVFPFLRFRMNLKYFHFCIFAFLDELKVFLFCIF